jgi:cell division protease FtsH
MFAIKTIPYSEFLKLLKENKVVEVAISANQIVGKIKDSATGKEEMFLTKALACSLIKRRSKVRK